MERTPGIPTPERLERDPVACIRVRSVHSLQPL